MAGIDYYHCAECDKKMLYIHSEEAECDEMYCPKCYAKLQAENKQFRTLKKMCQAIVVYNESRKPDSEQFLVRPDMFLKIKQALQEQTND